MKKLIIALLLLLPVGAFAQSDQDRYLPPGPDGMIPWAGKGYCEICDKRFGKWTPYFSSLFSGDMMFSPSSPSGSWHGTPRVRLDGESEIEVCPDCAEKYRGIYKHTIDQRKKDFILHKRSLEANSIERNRKDNAAYKEKQDEIDKLQKRIQELEWERQWGFVFPQTGGVTFFTGTSQVWTKP